MKLPISFDTFDDFAKHETTKLSAFLQALNQGVST